MKITCFLTRACGSEAQLIENITRALEAEGAKAEISVRRLDEAAAARARLSGSPSVLIDGVELQPLGHQQGGFS